MQFANARAHAQQKQQNQFFALFSSVCKSYIRAHIFTNTIVVVIVVFVVDCIECALAAGNCEHLSRCGKFFVDSIQIEEKSGVPLDFLFCYLVVLLARKEMQLAAAGRRRAERRKFLNFSFRGNAEIIALPSDRHTWRNALKYWLLCSGNRSLLLLSHTYPPRSMRWIMITFHSI